MKTANKPTYSFLLLTIVLIIINTLVARFLAFPSPVGPAGLNTIYPAVALMILFTLWFGCYGAIAAYAGCFIGAGVLSGMPPDVAAYWSFADLWQVLIPLVALRMLRINLDLSTRRDQVNVVLFAVLINNAFGAAWGTATLAIGNVIEWVDISSTFGSWFIANVIITTVIVIPAIFYLTPAVQKSRLFVRQYWQ